MNHVRKNPAYNNNLNPWDLSEKAKLDDEAMKIMDSWVIKHDVGTRRETNIQRQRLTGIVHIRRALFMFMSFR